MNLPFAITEPLVTERLVLRSFSADDREGLAELQRAPGIARFLEWDAPTDGELDARLERRLGDTVLVVDGDRLSWAVTHQGGSTMVADVTMMLTSVEHQQLEIGYCVAPSHQRSGYGTEVARAMVAFGFGVLGAHRIVGRIDARNHPSASVLERAGLQKEAHLRHNELVKGRWIDEAVFAVLRSEWIAGRR